MVTLDRLQDIADRTASLFVGKNQLVRHGLLMAAEDASWHAEEGFRYASLAGTPFADTLAQLTRNSLDGIEIDLVDVDNIPIHRHMKSDITLVVLPDSMGQGWFELNRRWNRIYQNQVITLPKGALHGFTSMNPNTRLGLLGFNYPPIGDDDTIFLS
ncbi:MAG: hypothetical protein AB203_04075 [Parcubacteria bacterium C7867-008]|nr:MAG: hypothetical protein AB203_04075 [Parcubacteria bacterium C7867-008]